MAKAITPLVLLLAASAALAVERPFREPEATGEGRIEGQVLLGGETPAGRTVVVEVYSAAGNAFHQVVAGSDGRYVIEAVRPGSYVAKTRSSDSRFQDEGHRKKPCTDVFGRFCAEPSELDNVHVRSGQTLRLDFDLAERVRLRDAAAFFNGHFPRYWQSEGPVLPGRYRYTRDWRVLDAIIERGYDPALDELHEIELTAGANPPLPELPPDGPNRGIAVTLTFPPDASPWNPSLSARINLYDLAGRVIRSEVVKSEDRSPVRAVFSPLPAGQSFYVRTESYGVMRRLAWGTVVDQIYPGVVCPGQACELSRGTAITVPSAESIVEVSMSTRLGSRVRWSFLDRATGEPLTVASPCAGVLDSRGNAIAYSNSCYDGGPTEALPGGTYYVRTFTAGINPQGLPNNWPIPSVPYFDRVYGGSECRGRRCSLEGATPVTISGRPDEEIQIEFLLDPGFVLYGDVRDVSTGRPIGGARVRLRDMAGEDLGIYEASATGRFRTGALRSGRYRLETTDNGDYADVYGDSSACPATGCDPRGGPVIGFLARANVQVPDLWLTASGGDSASE